MNHSLLAVFMHNSKGGTVMYKYVLGGDDGFLNVWDLRSFASKTPVAIFKHHTAPVTTVEWHPTDSAVFASGGADNQIALWDLSVERDQEAGVEDVEVNKPLICVVCM